MIGKHFSDVSEAMTLMDFDELELVRLALEVVKKNGGTIFTFGNGGSHSTASHVVNDLMKMAKVRAVCIGDMPSVMLAYGNDEGWRDMFLKPLQDMLRGGDGVVGISCSGESENVIRALEWAVGEGVISIGLTGLGNSTRINRIGLNALAHVRSADMRVQEDVHLMACHAIVRAMQEAE